MKYRILTMAGGWASLLLVAIACAAPVEREPGPDPRAQQRDAEAKRHKALTQDMARRAPAQAPRVKLSELWPVIERLEFETDEAYAERLGPWKGPGEYFYLEVDPIEARYSVPDKAFFVTLCSGLSESSRYVEALWLEDQLQDYTGVGRVLYGYGEEKAYAGQRGYSYQLGITNYDAFWRAGALACVQATKYQLRVPMEMERAKELDENFGVLVAIEFDERRGRWEGIVARAPTFWIPVEVAIESRCIAARLVMLIVYDKSTLKTAFIAADLGP